MATPLKVLSNAQTTTASGEQGGGFSKQFQLVRHAITAGTTVTQLPIFVLPTWMTGALVTNVYLMTGGTAPSAGTLTATLKKNGATALCSTDPTVTTTAGTNTSVNVNSGATTGYTIPVLSTVAARTLTTGDSITVDVTGGATATLQGVIVEIQDMSGVSG